MSVSWVPKSHMHFIPGIAGWVWTSYASRGSRWTLLPGAQRAGDEVKPVKAGGLKAGGRGGGYGTTSAGTAQREPDAQRFE